MRGGLFMDLLHWEKSESRERREVRKIEKDDGTVTGVSGVTVWGKRATRDSCDRPDQDYTD